MVSSEYSIDIKINEQGEIESTVNGVQGPSCEDLTAWLEELGTTVEHRHTEDFYRRQTTATRVRVGG
jgi:hypothetical protein